MDKRIRPNPDNLIKKQSWITEAGSWSKFRDRVDALVGPRPSDKAVLISIVDAVRPGGQGGSFQGYERIANRKGLSEKTIRRSVRYWKLVGVIGTSRIYDRARRRYMSTSYSLLLSPLSANVKLALSRMDADAIAGGERDRLSGSGPDKMSSAGPDRMPTEVSSLPSEEKKTDGRIEVSGKKTVPTTHTRTSEPILRIEQKSPNMPRSGTETRKITNEHTTERSSNVTKSVAHGIADTSGIPAESEVPQIWASLFTLRNIAPPPHMPSKDRADVTALLHDYGSSKLREMVKCAALDWDALGQLKKGRLFGSPTWGAIRVFAAELFEGVHKGGITSTKIRVSGYGSQSGQSGKDWENM